MQLHAASERCCHRDTIVEPYLENRFRILPVGVVSKKLMGDLKIACAILSCSFREAYPCPPSASAISLV